MTYTDRFQFMPASRAILAIVLVVGGAMLGRVTMYDGIAWFPIALMGFMAAILNATFDPRNWQ